MKYTNRFAALALAVTMGAGFVTMPFAAHASEEGRRNTAIGLGAAAAALLLTQKNKLPGAVVAAGAVIAATQIGSDHDRHRRDRDYGYDNRDYDNRRYNDGYNSGYRNNEHRQYSEHRQYNDNYGYNDNRRYPDDVRNNHDRYNQGQYNRDQYSRNQDRNYNDSQSGYRVNDNSARYHEQGNGREARKAR